MNLPHKNFILYLSIVTIIMISCETNPVIDESKIQDHYYVKCLMVYKDQKSETITKQSLSLTKLRYGVDIASSDDQSYGVENAEVVIISGDSTYYFENISEGYYETNLFAEYGTKYRLEITTPDGDFLWSETVTPDTLQIECLSDYDTVSVQIDKIITDTIYIDNINYITYDELGEFSSNPFIKNCKTNPDSLYLNADFYFDGDFGFSTDFEKFLGLNTSQVIKDNIMYFSCFSKDPERLDSLPPVLSSFTFMIFDDGYSKNQLEKYQYNDLFYYLNLQNTINGGYGIFGSLPAIRTIPFYFVSENWKGGK